MDNCWLITIEKEIISNVPREPLEGKPTSTEAYGEIISGITVTETMTDAHERRIKNYKDKLLDCDNKYSRAFFKIWLNCEVGPRVYVKGIKCPNKIWSTLKTQYEASDLSTRDNIVSLIICHTQSDFKTVAEYRDAMKQLAAKCVQIRNFVATWLQNFFFWLGLHFDLE